MLFINSPNRKRLVANFASLAVLRGFDFIIPLITLPYLVRVLGVDKFGLINFALSLALYFGAIIQYGFRVTATREVARLRTDKHKLSEIYSATLATTLMLAGTSGVFFLAIVLMVEKFSEYLALYLFSVLFVIFQAIFPVWFFQGMERMKFIAYLTLTAKVLSLIGIFTIITAPDQYYFVPLINAVAAFVSFVAASWLIRYHFGIHFCFPNLNQIGTLLSEGRHAFISQLAPNLYNNSSTFLLGFFASNTVVGYYTAAAKVIDAFNSIGHIVSNTFLPYLSRTIEKHGYFQKIMLAIGCLLTLIAIAAADPIVALLFGRENILIVPYVQWLAASIFMIFVSLAHGTNYLMLVGKDRLAKNIALYTSATFGGLAFVLIPVWEIWGAIATVVGARASLAFFSFVYHKKHFRQLVVSKT